MTPRAQEYFGVYFESAENNIALSAIEIAVIDSCEKYVESRFSKMKYILGLSMDFTLLAQQISKFDPKLNDFRQRYSESELFKDYELVASRAETKANTLTLKVKENNFGIRKLEELVLKYFISEGKTSYPSAYVYNTGQWAKYKDLLTNIFSLSTNGRFILFERLLKFGNEKLLTATIKVLETTEDGIFDIILDTYPRSDSNENGGLMLQAIAYGYISQIHDHLSIVASKVRTGSARQKRFGDIDCYLGDELVISFEVKDIEINGDNYEKNIGAFVQAANEYQVQSILICSAYSEDVIEKTKNSRTTFLSLEEIRSIIKYWDFYKQQNAVKSILHFLANIEQNESAVNRLKSYLTEVNQVLI